MQFERTKSMREHTEIRISKSEYELSEILEVQESISFEFEDNVLSRKIVGGRPLEIHGESIVFETQGYYDGLSLSTLSEGTKVELFKSFRRTEKIADGIIERRYFVKANKKDWNIKEEIIREESNVLNIDLEFSEEEKEMLSYGCIPLSMDDKWFVYFENNVIHFFRSWTGVEIFQAEFIPSGNANWRIGDLIVNNDEKYNGINELSLFATLMNTRLRRMKKLND